MGAVELNRVLDRIAAAAVASGRDPASVLLVAISKGRSDAEVAELYQAGLRHFGENRADALTARLASSLPEDVVWHFVGPLQRRKVKVVAGRVALLHSLDRIEVARSWVDHGGGPALLQVNVSAEPQKHGFAVAESLDAAAEVVAMGVDLRGLMAIPAAPERSEDSRRPFEELSRLGAELADRYPAAVELSMGMTDDYEVAVECGATIVRLGRAIFEQPAVSGRDGG